MLNPVQISCISSNWRGMVLQTLGEIREIDLVHFLFPSDAEFCLDIASKYGMDFTADPERRVAFFRKRQRANGSKPPVYKSVLTIRQMFTRPVTR